MAKARKYRARVATAESTSWEVAASLCFRSSYSLQKLSHISDKTMLQATSLIQAANFHERDSSQSQAPASLVIGAYDPAYCSVSLPSPQVLTHHQSVEQLEHAHYNVLAAFGSNGDHRG